MIGTHLGKTKSAGQNGQPAEAVACVWGAATDKGKVRPNNEDSYIGNGVLFAVADGLGAYEGGHIASQLAVNVLLRETFQRPLPLGADPRNWLRDDEESDQFKLSGPGVYALFQAFQQANKEVVVKSQSDFSLASMGTTLCAMQLYHEIEAIEAESGHTANGEAGAGDGNDTEANASDNASDHPNNANNGAGPYFAIANVGDSRVYCMSGNRLEQISDDHTYVADLVRLGLITSEEAATHKRRNELTRALGPFGPVHPAGIEVDVWEVPARAGDRYLLCTDGLVLEVAHKAITKLLRKHADPQAAADALLKAAMDGGGRDNITVVVVDVIAAAQQPDQAVTA